MAHETQAKNRKKQRGFLWRWTRRFLLFLLVLVLITGLFIAFLTQTGQGRKFLIHQVSSVLSHHVFSGTIEARRIEGPIFGRFTLRDVRLTDDREKETATIETASVRYLFRDLIHRRITIETVDVDGVTVQGRIREDGSLNLGALFIPGEEKDEPSPLGITIELKRLALQNADVRIVDERVDELVIGLRNSELVADFQMDEQDHLYAGISKLGSDISFGLAPGAEFAARIDDLFVDMKPETIDFAAGRLTVGETGLFGFEGSVKRNDPDDPNPKGMFKYFQASMPQLVFSPDEVRAFVPDLPLIVPLKVDASIEGPPDAVMLKASLTGADQDATAKMIVDTTQGVDMALKAMIDIERFHPELWLDFPGMEGDINGQIRVRAQGLTPQRLNATLEIDIDRSTLLGYQLDTGNLRLHYAKDRADLEVMDFRAGSASLQGNGHAGLDGDLTLHIDLHVPDLSALAANAPIQDDLAGSLRTIVDVNGAIDVKNLDTDALKTIDGIMDHVVRRLDTQATIQMKSIRAPGIAVQSFDGSIEGKKGEEPHVQLLANARRIALGGVVIDTSDLDASVMGHTLSVEGTVDALGAHLALDADGRWSTNDVALTLHQLDIAAKDVDVALQSPAYVTVALGEGGALRQVDVRTFDLGGKGLSIQLPTFRYGADGEIDGRFTVAVEDLKALSAYELLESLEPLGLRGTIEATGLVAGRIDKPRYDVHMKTTKVHAMGIGPVDGRLHVSQSAKQMNVDGLLCLREPRGPEAADEECGDGRLLLRADGLVLPIRPGFSSVGPNFYQHGPFDGFVEIGPLEIARFYRVIEDLKTWKVKGTVALKMIAGGDFDNPNIGLWVDLDQTSFTVPGYAADADARIDALETHLTLKIANDEHGLSFVRWGLGDKGISVGGVPWIYARGDAKAPLRDFLLGRVDMRTLVTQTTGELLSLEIPTRSLRDLPTAVLPKALGRDGTVYAAVNITRGDAFSGAKVTLHGSDLHWDTIGPLNLYLSALSSGDTVLHLDALDGQMGDIASVDVQLAQSFTGLLTKGIEPTNELRARVSVPELAIEDLPDALFQKKLRDVLDGMKRRDRGPSIDGYLDVTGPLRDLRAQGRFRMRNVLTASGDTTEAGLHVLFGPSRDMGFGGDARRLQVLGAVCGAGNACALQMHAAVEVDASSGTFLFGSSDAQEKAIDGLLKSPYAVQLNADKASIAAMIPPWLFQDLVTDVDGEFSADLRVQGQGLGFPKMRGTVEVDHMRAEVIPLGRKFKDIDVKAAFHKERIEIDTFHVDDGAGVMNATGDFKRVSEREAAGVFDMHFDRFLLSDGSGLGAYLTADIPMDIRWNASGLHVDVPIDNASIYVPDSVITASTSGPRTLPDNVIFVPDESSLRAYIDGLNTQVEEEEDEENQLEKVSIPIDVHIRSLKPVYVQQRFADLDVNLDMRLALREGQIQTSGGVEIPRGYAQVFGKRFDIEQGRVLFDGGGDGPFDPRIRVRARHRLPRKTAAVLEPPSGDFASVSVVIDSHVSNLDVRLESDPPLSESDVLNVLLTGRPVETDDSERPEALAAAGTLLAGFLTDQMGENPVLDTLSVELDDGEGGMDSRFEGGRYFGKNKRIYASVAYIAGADVNENTVEVSWQFILAQLRRSSMRLELRWGDRRSGSMELLYNLRVDRGWRLVRSREKQETEQKDTSP